MADSSQIRSDLLALPLADRKALTLTAADSLPTADRREVAGSLATPTQPVTNIVWLMVVCAFVLVLLGAAGAIIVAVYRNNKVETLLILFTTVSAFLAGLLAPSPVSTIAR